MSIYRGAGGAGDAVADSASEALLVQQLAAEAQVDADAAAASATAAAGSATTASSNASAAGTSATNAATSATNASNSATSASGSASTATTQASNASTSATAAAASATSASNSATTATTQATNASTSASGASTSATNAANSATTASTQASNASTSASNASTSATNAANSATSASGSATSATSSASSASTSATNAASSATSATNSASTATTQAGIATTQASNASTSATNASNSATTSSTQASNAASSASAASTSASNAATSATDAAASYDSFDDRYLGPKSSAPTLDNDGNALLTGALYFNTATNEMKVWSGSAWLNAYASLSGALIATNNLSDLNNTTTARTNLGLGSIATQASNSIAITGGSAALTTGSVSTSPSASTDIANKSYVDSVAQGLNVKAAVLVATTASITLVGGQVIDGVTVVSGDRVLVKNQSTASTNGIYNVQTTVWTRTNDADTWNELVSAFVFVEQGTTQSDTGFVCTADPGGTLGVTAVNWTQFSGAGTYTAGTGLTLTGTQFSVTNTGTAGTYGSATLIPVITTNAQGQVTGVTTASNPQGTVTSVGITAGTAISVSGSPITGSGSITVNNTGVTSAVAGTGISISGSTGAVTITNSAPDQTVALTAGTGITTSGTYPNFTITNSSPATAATVAKAWVKWVGSSGSISASYNVSSVTRNSTGHYTVNFSSSLADGNYAVAGMVFNQSSGNGARSLVSEGTPGTGSFQVFNMLFNGSQEDANASVIVFR